MSIVLSDRQIIYFNFTSYLTAGNAYLKSFKGQNDGPFFMSGYVGF
jgi:hypothetical protein